MTKIITTLFLSTILLSGCTNSKFYDLTCTKQGVEVLRLTTTNAKFNHSTGMVDYQDSSNNKQSISADCTIESFQAQTGVESGKLVIQKSNYLSQTLTKEEQAQKQKEYLQQQKRNNDNDSTMMLMMMASPQ